MVYRFARVWDGRVCPEARTPHLDPFLGLQFPHTDIPAQARALYMEQLLRVLPDVHYQPIPLEPQAEEQHTPSDLSNATLRSVSPLHIEYLQNMGVAATLVISLRVNNILWGLIASHHQTPKHIPITTRTHLQLIAEALTNQIASQLVTTRQQRSLELASFQQKFWRTITAQTNLPHHVTNDAEHLCHMVRADGLLITNDGHTAAYGHIPASIQPLLKNFANTQLAQRIPGEQIIHATLQGTSAHNACLLYTSPSPRHRTRSRMPRSA